MAEAHTLTRPPPPPHPSATPFTLLGKITDLVSFYTLPSTVVARTGGHEAVTAAFQYYCVPGQSTAKALVADALVLARDT